MDPKMVSSSGIFGATRGLGTECVFGAEYGGKGNDVWRFAAFNVNTMPSQDNVNGKIKIDKWRRLIKYKRM